MALSVVNSAADQIWAGALTDMGFTVQADLSHAVQTNLVVALAADTGFSSPVARTAVIAATQTDNATGGKFYTAKHAVTGLTPNTAYRYALESNGTRRTGSTGLIKTAPTQGTPAAFSFAFGSCSNYTNGTGLPSGPETCQALENIAAESGCLFFLHTGDLIYDDYTGGVLTAKRSNNRFTRAFRSSSSAKTLCAAMPVAYTWSDHDSTADDMSLADGSTYSTQITCSTTVYQECVPHYELVDTETLGIAQSWWVGSCFFVMPDCYSFRNESGSPPPLLGEDQFDWVVAEVTAAVSAGATLIFIVSSPTWTDSPYLGWNPTWATEQTALLDALKVIPGLPGVCILEGDNHKFGADDGGHTDYSTGGGMKIVRLLSSPLKVAAALSGGEACVWDGVTTTNSSWTRGYCRVDVNAAGDGFTATFKGRASGDGAFSTLGPYTTDDLAGW
jgi:hypothetical protein